MHFYLIFLRILRNFSYISSCILRNFSQLSNRDDDIYISVSITAECNTLKSPQEGPERLRMIPVEAEIVPPKCSLPDNYTGVWVNTANFDAEVTINTTHMVEKWNPDTGKKNFLTN